MSKLFMLTVLVLMTACPPGQAQEIADRQFTAAQGDPGTGWADLNQGRTSDITMTQGNQAGSFFTPPPDNTHTQTTQQNSYQNNFRGGAWQTVTSMPFSGSQSANVPVMVRVPTVTVDQYGNQIIVDKLVPQTDSSGHVVRQNSFAAPGNFAARQWGGGVLHPTTLDSIVAESGYNFMVFGDEGTVGPPPLSDFETLDSGVFATTGHPSDAPSAWGWPN